MKIAILSDIHANIYALDSVLEEVYSKGAEEFWVLGDIVDYGVFPNEVIDCMKHLKITHWVGGNHDASLFDEFVRKSKTPHGQEAYLYTEQKLSLESKEWLEEFSKQQYDIVKEYSCYLVHGIPSDPYWGKFKQEDSIEELFADVPMECNCILLGHSHVQFELVDSSGKYRVVNPGSVGQPRNGFAEAQYALFDGSAFQLNRVSYEVEKMASAILEAGLPKYLADRLFIGK